MIASRSHGDERAYRRRGALGVRPETLLVAERGEALLGAVIAAFDGVRGWIYHLAVAPQHRRLGDRAGAAALSFGP